MSDTTNQEKLIKCQSCGANIQIEGDFCPYCGMAKAQFAEHREQMAGFTRDYIKVRNFVVEKNRKTSRNAVYIAILMVMVVLLALEFMATGLSHGIHKTVRRVQINHHVEEYVAMLDMYETEGEFDALSRYYYANDLDWAYDQQEFKEYELLLSFTSFYEGFVDSMLYVAFPDYTGEHRRESFVKEKISYLVHEYVSFQDLQERYITKEYNTGVFDESVYSQKHLDSYELINEKMDIMMINLLGFTEEEMTEFRELSEYGKTQAVLEKYDQIRETYENGQG
ncbi:MAG: hypothetical protein HUJ70_09820 [Pseudobutyrivibrio sp.]|nr:hypothetical protein [Pseudobutyrivibrio sp.]